MEDWSYNLAEPVSESAPVKRVADAYAFSTPKKRQKLDATSASVTLETPEKVKWLGCWREGLGGTSDAEHLILCAKERREVEKRKRGRKMEVLDCGRCLWIKNKDAWQSKFPWLESRIDMSRRRWGLGCSSCCSITSPESKLSGFKIVNTKCPFANFEVASTAKTQLRAQRFRKHELTLAHETAAAGSKLANAIGSAEGVQSERLSAPALQRACASLSMSDWEKVYSEMVGTNPTSIDGVPGVGGRKKVRCMQWCLAEAQRQRHIEMFKSAVSTSLSLDKRATRFLMRFITCDAGLSVNRGVICLSREVADIEVMGADKIRQATLMGIEKACKKPAPPRRHNEHDEDINLKSDDSEPPLDSAALAALLKTIECLTADAASDVQLGGRELAGAVQLAGANCRPLKGVMAQCLPNLKVYIILPCH